MRCTLHSLLCITALVVMHMAMNRGALAYQLGDSLILKQFQATSHKITAYPTLWQVIQQKEPWNEHRLQYELLVEHPQANAHPTLTLFSGAARYIITLTDNPPYRILLLKGPLTSSPTAEVETTEGTSSHPMGTFDFAALFSSHPDVLSTLFVGLKDNRFSGQFRIIQGLPLWIYEKDSFPWRLEMIRHHFFPYRITWKKNNPHHLQWTFQTQIDYQPWGIMDATPEAITYQEVDADSSDSSPLVHSSWTLIQQFKQPSELSAWKAKYTKRAVSPSEPWNRDNRLLVLRSY